LIRAKRGTEQEPARRTTILRADRADWMHLLSPR
jgi:hypothetical protein